MITVEKAKKLRAIIERAVAALELDNEAALECVELFRHGRTARRTLSKQEYSTTESSIVAYKRTRRKAIGLRRSPPLFGAA